MRRLALVALTLLAVAAAGLAVLLFAEFDAPEMGKALLARVQQATGAEVTVERFRLRLVRGLALEGLDAKAAFDGGRAELELEALVFDHRLWSLLRGRIDVERVVLDGLRLRLVETRPARRQRAPAEAAGALAALAWHVGAVDLKDAQIAFVSPRGANGMAVEGLDLELRDFGAPAGKPTLSTVTGRGQMRIAAVALESGRRVRDVTATARLQGGRLECDDLRFRTDEGPFEGRLSVRLDRLPFTYALALEGQPLDLGSAAAVRAEGLGAATIELDVTGSGSEPKDVSGRGVLRLAAGRLPSSPLIGAVQTALGGRRIAGEPYRATEAPFRVERGRILLDRLRVQSDALALDVGGWTSFEGPLALQVAVRTPREGLRLPGVPPGALDALTDEDGWVSVPLKVSGTQERPRVAPDTAVLAAQARRAAGRSLLDKAGGALGGLFRRRER